MFRNQVSAPYSKTERTFDLKSLNLVFMEMLLEFQILFKLAKAVLDLLILALTSVKVPPASSILLPRYSKQLTSSRIWFPIVIGSWEFAFNLSILVFGTFISSPTFF